MYNKVILIGNLTRDTELRYTPQGSPVVNFGIATNKKYGEKEEVFFGDCTAWGKLAETCSKYLSKGSKILLEGRLVTEFWTDGQGKKYSKVKIIAETIRFMSKKKENGQSSETTDLEPF